MKITYEELEYRRPPRARSFYRWDAVPTGRNVVVNLGADGSEAEVRKNRAFRLRGAARARARSEGLLLVTQAWRPYDTITLRFDS